MWSCCFSLHKWDLQRIHILLGQMVMQMHGISISRFCAQGWQWVNEGKSPERPKWGFVSETEGESLAIQVRQSILHSSAQEKALQRGIISRHVMTCYPQHAWELSLSAASPYVMASMVQVPTDSFTSGEAGESDNSSLTVAVSCLMSYEHTGGCFGMPFPSLPISWHASAHISRIRQLI